MLMSTVVAVALGLTPTQQSSSAQIVSGDYSAEVGQFTQYVDSRGTTHLSGRDRRGIAYDLVMDRHGYVEADVGEQVVNFRVQEAS
jgi:hypothetical protein